MQLLRERNRRVLRSWELARLSCPLSSRALLLCALFFLLAFTALQPREASADSIAWWDNTYGYREQLTITNNSGSPLPSGYSVCVSLDHSPLVEAGKSLSNGDDIRIVYWNGSTSTELDRVNESSWHTPGTDAQIWFKVQADIAGSGTDNNYFIYYGNKAPTSPPANRSNVYEFFDDFSSYTMGQYTSAESNNLLINSDNEAIWKIQSGTWNIESDTQADGTTGKVLSQDAGSGPYTYAYALNKDYDNLLVEVKMRTKNGEYGGYWPFGARLNVSTGANYTAWSYNDCSRLYRFSGWSSPFALITGTTRPYMGNSWHTFRFTLDGEKLNLYFDGVSYGCYVEDTTLTSGTIFATGSANRRMHFDDFKVRKYTTNEPSVLAGSEEMGSLRPMVSLDRKWRLKGDGYTATDQHLGVSVNFPEAEGMPEAQASYEIEETDLSGSLSRTGPTSWQGQVDISSLLTGTFGLVVTVSDTAQQYSSDLAVFHISYPFYFVWSVDWEGEYAARVPYLDSLAILADEHGIPISHLFNARVYVWPGIAEWQRVEMTQWLLERAQTKGDEIGLHLHMYTDYVDSAGVTPMMYPQWGDRTDGYDVPFANYNYEQSLALLNLAIELFQERGLGRPSTFRAGGWFADEENLRALSDLGFLIDASGSTYHTIGHLPSPWNLGITSQPYYPCSEEQNAQNCGPGDTNLPLLEIPNNLANTDGSADRRAFFDMNYSGDPLDSVRVGVLLSHDRSATGDERVALEQYFAHVDSFLYVADRGAVVYATLAEVREALSGLRPDPPDLLGPPDLVSGGLLQQCDEAFVFRLHDRDSLNSVKYRIQISWTPGYDHDRDIVVDYVSGMTPQGFLNFTVGQPESTGTYIRGGNGQTLPPGPYYWRVMAIDSEGECSWWSRADAGAMAFAIQGPEGIENGPDANPAIPLAVSFCNPSGPSVFLKAQVPVAGKATLRIFDCSGRLMRTLPLEGLHAGGSSLYWDGRDSEGRCVSSGIYFVELSQSGQAITKKLVLVK